MYKKYSLSTIILTAIEKSIEGYIQIEDFIYNPGKYVYGAYDRPITKNKVITTIRRLKQKGTIDYLDDQQLVLKLTEYGRQQAIIKAVYLNDSNWDGQWRIVIFDIPEKRRIARDLLRNRLKEWGFTQKQKSVWITKRNVTKPLKEFIKQIGIQEWVIVFEASQIE